MKLQLKEGTIKKYDPLAHEGKISLAVPRPDRKLVWFHRSGCAPVHEIAAEMQLVSGSVSDREPQEDDRVVLYVEERDGNPVTLRWSYADRWNLGTRIIAAREAYASFYCHVLRVREGARSVEWDGWKPNLDRYLANNKLNFDEQKGEYFVVERLHGHGWEPMEPPEQWHHSYMPEEPEEMPLGTCPMCRRTDLELLKEEVRRGSFGGDEGFYVLAPHIDRNRQPCRGAGRHPEFLSYFGDEDWEPREPDLEQEERRLERYYEDD